MRYLGAATAVGSLGGLAGCVGGDGNGDDGGNGGTGQGDENVPAYNRVDLVPPPSDLQFDPPEYPELEVAMVVHNGATSYFIPHEIGTHEAASFVGWDANFTGPSQGADIQRQMDIVDNLVTSGIDALGMVLVDGDAAERPINNALDNDIPVVTFSGNTMTEDEMRDSFGRVIPYVGLNYMPAGYVAGLKLVEELPDDAQKVTVGLNAPDDALLARAEGIEMAVRHNADVEITNRVEYSPNASEGVSTLEQHISSTPDLDAVVGVDAYAYFIGNAVENLGVADEIVAGGFDLTEPTLEHISNGTMDFTVGQNPYLQGFLPVLFLWAYMQRGVTPPSEVSTGAEVVDQSNIDFARERSGSWGDLRDHVVS